MKRFLFAFAGLVLLLGTGRFVARDVEADPKQTYSVTAEVGGWMICAASYTGPEASQLAHDMVLEIRQNYNLPAYLFNRGADERRKQREELDRIRQLTNGEGRPRFCRIEEQFAVLVGGYKDMESARKALDGFKKLQPSQKLMASITTAKPTTKDGQKGMMIEKAYLNPFLSAFVVRNPTAAVDHTADKAPDPFLKKLNSGETYSIYKCKKPFTLAVAIFQGAPLLQQPDSDPSFFAKLIGASSGEQLAASALNAHNLAQVLSGLGYETYVFHTRYNSVVSVGSFERGDDPQIARMSAVLHEKIKAQPQVRLLAQPLPMPVPK